MDDLSGGDLSLNGIEEADELLMPVALHVLTDYRAVENIESGKERCGARPCSCQKHSP